MKIVKLTSENVKRLQAVEINPDGAVVVIGGKNGAGKSSVLDSIEYALGGDPDAKMPVRRGEEKARIVVDLGEIVVKRTFTAAGGTALVVTNADGVKQASPQAILDKLTGKLTFDPLSFSRQTPKAQAETLRGLVGLDFAKMDTEREQVFNERTAVNREVKALESRMAAMPKHDGLPDVETSTAEIMAEQRKASEHNSSNAELRRKASEARSQVRLSQTQLDRINGRITSLRQELETCTAALKTEQIQLAELEATSTKLNQAESKIKDIDLSPFQAKAAKTEDTNRKIRENRERTAVVHQFKAKSDESAQLTAKLDEIDGRKRKATLEAKYPIEGLSFDPAGGVTMNGIPFEQCSSAEQLRVSVAIGLALNPKLRVLLIRDGSLLDDESMKLLAAMAAEAKAQVWLERVGSDAATSVVIEDGHVAEKSEAE